MTHAPPTLRLRKRILLCAAVAPPHQSGHGAVLERIFREIDPADYCIVSFRYPQPSRPGLPALAGKLYEIPTEWRPEPEDGAYPLATVRSNRRFATEVLRRARRLVQLARTERCAAIVVTTSPMGAPDTIAAWLACRRLGLTLVVYMLDEWQQMANIDPRLRFSSSILGRLVVPRADGVIVPNPFVGRDVQQMYGRSSVVVANLTHAVAESMAQQRPRPWPSFPPDVRLVFTGQLSDLQVESLVRVVDALESPRLANVSLHLYCPVVPDTLYRPGTTRRVTVHPFVLPSEVAEVQQTADILVLPLAFGPRYADVITTAAPAKLGEYLVSGRPMLVHAPHDSYVAAIARNEGVGELVDLPAPELIGDAILRIIDDPQHRQRLVSNATSFAEREYSPAATVDRFVSTLNGLLA